VDREAFRSWLVSKEPDETVGKTNTPLGCPLSTYLETQYGRMCIVGSDSWRIVTFASEFPAMDGNNHDLPDWARTFIHEIDSKIRQAPMSADWDGVYVTAKDALTTLDAID